MGDSPEERRETVALVIDEIDRMAQTVDELQSLAEAEHPAFLRFEPIDLTRFGEALTTKAAALAGRRVTLETAAEGTLTADRQRLPTRSSTSSTTPSSTPGTTTSSGSASRAHPVRCASGSATQVRGCPSTSRTASSSASSAEPPGAKDEEVVQPRQAQPLGLLAVGCDHGGDHGRNPLACSAFSSSELTRGRPRQ
jgi:hypothetical protein